MGELITIDKGKFSALEAAEKAVYLATQDKRVRDMTSVELGKALNEALRWIVKDIGVRNQSEDDMRYLVVRLTELLKRYYGEFSVRDFRMAFELALTGELDDFLPKGKDGRADREHYQNINAEYVCKILNAYKGKRRAVLRKMIPEPTSLPEMTEARKKELEDRARAKLKAAYLRFLQSGEVDITPIQEIVFYGILSERGLVRPVEVTEAEKRAVLGAVLNEMIMKGASAGEVYRKKALGVEADDIKGRAFASARRKALENAFNSMKTEQINIDEYV